MSTQRRFDSIPRADSAGAAGAVAAMVATLLVGSAQAKFDGWALPHGERPDHNPFDARMLSMTLPPDLRMRLDGSRCKPYERLSAALLEAHLAGKGMRVRTDKLRADSAALPRDMEFIQSTPHETLYPDLKSRLNIPIDTSAPPGAQTITYRELTHYGEAALLANGAQDVPRVDVSRSETSVNVRTIACAYGYTIQDLESAAMAGLPLPAWKARSAELAMAQLTDSLLFAGNAAAGLVGFNTITGITPTPPVTGAWIATPATGDQALEDLYTLISGGITAQADIGAYEFNELRLPSAEYEWLKRTPVSTTDNKDSILATFMKLNPGINVQKWNLLSTAGAAGVTRAIAYRKNPLFCQGHIPKEATALAPQMEGFESVIYMYQRVGGVECQAPLSIGWMDGI